MEKCIFCEIANGKIEAHIVYEDENVIAILDKHPINPGHILVIPKLHEPVFYNLEDNLYKNIMLVVKKLSKIVNNVMKPKKVGLIVAGWDIPHTHIHIIPMNDYNDITSKSILENKRANPTNDELAKVAIRLRS